MISAAPGPNPGGDQVDVVLYDSAGAPMSIPGPHSFFNIAPGIPENIQLLIPFVGPQPDPALIGGVIEMTYSVGAGGPLDVTDIRVELI
jgi:hypothetical protein